MKLFYLVFFLILQLSLFGQNQSVCDLSPGIGSDNLNFTTSDLIPNYIKNDPNILAEYGFALPQTLYVNVVTFTVEYPELEDPLVISSFDTTARAFLFRCNCPDPSIDIFCENKTQEFIGELDFEMIGLQPDIYYVVILSEQIGTFNYSIFFDDGIIVVSKNFTELTCNTSESFEVLNEFETCKLDKSLYRSCYNGSRDYLGYDKAFRLNIDAPSLVNIELISDKPSGMFINSGVNCFRFEEILNGQTKAEFRELFLTPGGYSLLVDNDSVGEEFFFTLNINCTPIDDPKFFLDDEPDNCEVDASNYHSLNIPLSSNSNLLNRNPNVYLSYTNEIGNEKILGNISTVFSNNEIQIEIPSDKNGNSEKCAYEEGDKINILLGERNSLNAIHGMKTYFFQSNGEFKIGETSSVIEMEIESSDGFSIFPPEGVFSNQPLDSFNVFLNSSFPWTYKVTEGSDWLDLSFRTPPVQDNIFRAEPNSVFFSLEENISPQTRVADVEFFSVKNSLFKYKFQIKQFGKSISNTSKVITEEEILIFPNPTSDEILIYKNVASSKIKEVLLLDVLGNNISLEGGINSNNFIKIILPKVKPGMYFISGKIENTSFMKKLIIQQ